MSALNYTTRWPRGNARTAANKAIRRGLPGGDQILDASKLLTNAVRSSAGGAHYEQAMRLLSSGMASIEAHGASDLIVGMGLLRRSRNALRDYLAGISDANAGAALGLLEAALDDLRDAATAGR
jgi:hypothetical protein